MTLLELLIATSIMAIIVGTLGTLARGVQMGNECAQGYGAATQHARVALERIGRAVAGATANEQFPGVLVLAEQVGTWRFPDTVVIWHPTGQAVDPTGLPRFNELVIYCPQTSTPNRLLEITVPNDTRTAPPASDISSWQTEISAIRQSLTSHTVVLTELLRTATASSSSNQRGAVRFEVRLRPSDAQWSDYKAGRAAWNTLPWVQGIYGSRTGLRQAWLRTELQVMPGGQWVASDPSAQQPSPFLGSSALYYEMHP